MKIAIPYDNGEIFMHFGKTTAFKLYDSVTGQSEVRPVVGEGHEALAFFLKACGVSVVICGGIGQGMVNALTQNGMRVYGGNPGSADAAVLRLLTGSLQESGATCMCHEEHH